MSELKNDFLASFKSLMIRYNVNIVKSFSGFEDDNEVRWVFEFPTEDNKKILVDMEDIHKFIIEASLLK